MELAYTPSHSCRDSSVSRRSDFAPTPKYRPSPQKAKPPSRLVAPEPEPRAIDSRLRHIVHCRRSPWMSVLVTSLALLCEPVAATKPIAPHQLVVVDASGDTLIRLTGYDLDGDSLVATVMTLPGSSGSVYQLSKVRASSALPSALHVNPPHAPSVGYLCPPTRAPRIRMGSDGFTCAS